MKGSRSWSMLFRALCCPWDLSKCTFVPRALEPFCVRHAFTTWVGLVTNVNIVGNNIVNWRRAKNFNAEVWKRCYFWDGFPLSTLATCTTRSEAPHTWNLVKLRDHYAFFGMLHRGLLDCENNWNIVRLTFIYSKTESVVNTRLMLVKRMIRVEGGISDDRSANPVLKKHCTLVSSVVLQYRQSLLFWPIAVLLHSI